MKKNKTLQELFSFPSFRATKKLQGKFGDPKARIIELKRRKKRLNVLAVINAIRRIMIRKFVKLGIWILQIIVFTYVMINDVYFVCDAKACV
jgi:hypothetical protein